MNREIEVWADWMDLGTPILMGTLRSAPIRGKEVFSFSYDPAWLTAANPASRRSYHRTTNPCLRQPGRCPQLRAA